MQWTLSTPQDWTWIDLSVGRFAKAWQNLPKKAIPTAQSVIDGTPGWVFAINCQGIVMGGFDHYAAELITDAVWGNGVRFTLWQDDPQDFPPGSRWATVWELFDPAPDSAFGGAVNTRQRRTQYAETGAGLPDQAAALSWSQFTAPTNAVTAHGIWTSDTLFVQHRQVASLHGWREWAA